LDVSEIRQVFHLGATSWASVEITHKDTPRPRSGTPARSVYLLLNGSRRHVRVALLVLDPDAELVFLKDAQPLQLGGDDVEVLDYAVEFLRLPPL
jgi:hypothetical protein